MQRLSGLDAGFLYLERSWQPMNGCALWELDTSTMRGGYTFERLRDGLALHMRAIPRFREKLADSPYNLDHPVWVEDTDFDIDRHLNRVKVPLPGGRAELSELCGRIASAPLERNRPLWEMWILEGIGGSDPQQDTRYALMLKVHHACMDAQTGTDLLSRLCSAEADAPVPDAVDGVGNANQIQIALGGLARFMFRPVQLVKVLFTTMAWLLVKLSATHTKVARPFVAPRTAFNTNVTARRNIAYAQLDFEDVKKVKNQFNATINDVVMALVSAALRQFLLNHNELPDSSLLALVPVSVHSTPGRFGRNQVSNRFSWLPTRIDDPAERLRVIVKANALAKQSNSGIGATLLQDWLQFAGPMVFRLAMAVYAKSRFTERKPLHNVVVSNVPGPQVPLYFQGCRVLAQYPLGPVFPGSGLNITVMSLSGKLNIGITSCPDLLPDLWELADDFGAAMKELLLVAAG